MTLLLFRGKVPRAGALPQPADGPAAVQPGHPQRGAPRATSNSLPPPPPPAKFIAKPKLIQAARRSAGLLIVSLLALGLAAAACTNDDPPDYPSVDQIAERVIEHFDEYNVSRGFGHELAEFDEGEYRGYSRVEFDPFSGQSLTVVGVWGVQRKASYGSKLMLRCNEDNLEIVFHGVAFYGPGSTFRRISWVSPSTFGDPRRLTGRIFVDFDAVQRWRFDGPIPLSWLDPTNAKLGDDVTDTTDAKSFLAAILLDGGVIVKVVDEHNPSTSTYTFGDITAAEHWEDLLACGGGN